MNEQSFELDKYLSSVRARLVKMPLSHQIAFATLNCERLAPFFDIVAKDCQQINRNLFGNCIEQLWEYVRNNKIEKDEVQSLKNNLLSLEFTEEDESLEFFQEALDSLDAIELTLTGIIEGSASSFALASDRIIDSLIFRFISENLIDKNIEFNQEEFERNTLIIREKNLQNSILTYLEKNKSITSNEIDTLHQLINDYDANLLLMFRKH